MKSSLASIERVGATVLVMVLGRRIDLSSENNILKHWGFANEHAGAAYSHGTLRSALSLLGSTISFVIGTSHHLLAFHSLKYSLTPPKIIITNPIIFYSN